MKSILNNQDIPSLIKIHPLNTITTRESHGKVKTKETSCMTKSMPEYLPKRMIKFTPLKNISISAIGAANLYYEGFNAMKEPKNKANENDYLEFRTSYILRYAQNAEFFYKTKQWVDYFDSQDKKSIMSEYYHKIRKSIESQSRALFNINPYNFETSKNYAQWKTMVILDYELNNYFNKYCDLLFTELKNEKEQNMKHRKKNFQLETILQGKETELNNVNTYLNLYDVSNKIRLEKMKSESIETIKEFFTQKENSYLLTIFRLEDEIRDLTTLLDKNKEYYQHFKDCQSLVEKKKKEIEDMRVVYNKELNAKVIEIAILKDNEYILKTEVDELEKLNQTLTQEVETLKKDNLENQTQIIKLQMIVNERTENVNMVCEEMDTWLIELEDERNNHDNTTQALIALENRIIKEKEKEREHK